MQTNPAFAEQWVSIHANVSAALGKPLIVEEVRAASEDEGERTESAARLPSFVNSVDDARLLVQPACGLHP